MAGKSGGQVILSVRCSIPESCARTPGHRDRDEGQEVHVEDANEDQAIGIKILSRSIEEPLRQIVANAGEDAAVVLADVKKGKGTYGYNAATGVYGGMPDMGGMGDMGM